MFKHRIDDGEEFPHAGHQSDFGSLSRIAEPFVERANDRITSASDQGRHIKSGPYGSATAPNRAATSEGAAVAIERRHSDQRGDLFAVEFAEFGKLGEQRPAHYGPNARNGLEQVLAFTPDRTLANALIEVLIGSLKFFFEPADVGADALSQSFWSTAEPVGFGHNHLGDLPSSGNARAQFHSDLIGQGTNRWTDCFGETSQDPSIDAICLGQLSSRFG